MSRAARPAAALIAGLCLAALVAQGLVTRALPGASWPGALWQMAGYFTVLTNAIVAVSFTAIAAGWRVPARRAAALVLWIGVVGLVYHAVLAGLWAPKGLAWWADQGLHSAVPVAVALWWAAFAPKAPLGFGAIGGWLVWPLAYCAFALLRGGLTGFWPYPFLDLAALGPVAVAINIAGLVALFAGLGAALVAVARITR